MKYEEIVEQEKDVFLEFKEEFKEMCESGSFRSDITRSDVEYLINLVEAFMECENG